MSFIDPVCVPDVFVTALASAENLGGGNFRFTFVTAMNGEEIVCARIVAHVDAVTPAICMAAKAIGLYMLPSREVEIRAH